MLSVSRSLFFREIPKDPCGTIEGHPARGLRLSVELMIPHPDHVGHSILHRVSSPGLWGIADNESAIRDVCRPSTGYWADVWAQEERLLVHMLTALGVKVEG